jgi:hypothetical protein
MANSIRDSFGRFTLRRIVTKEHRYCSWCGTMAIPRHPLYSHGVDDDRRPWHEEYNLGVFCSWTCYKLFYGRDTT